MCKKGVTAQSSKLNSYPCLLQKFWISLEPVRSCTPPNSAHALLHWLLEAVRDAVCHHIQRWWQEETGSDLDFSFKNMNLYNLK